jgi:N-carbamoyl-L-amino-acid hydrolase
MAEAGLAVEIDAAANLIGRRPGRHARGSTLRGIATGSHLDTVHNGGPLDGAYGVVAAIEAAAAGPETDHRLAVVAFSNEEGSVAPPGFTGSKAIAGVVLDTDGIADDDGHTLAQLIAGAGGRPADLASCAWPPGSLAAFVELHIEQGPVLERAAATLGVVESITGRILVDAEITGQASHAGTTPMDVRHDALLAAAHLVVAVNDLACSGHVRVATAGRIACLPNLHNVVAGKVSVGIDIRDSDDDRLRGAVEELENRVAAIAAAQAVTITLHRGGVHPSVRCDDALVALLADVARRCAPERVLRMPSGASHDAQVMAAIAPVAMLFVPSVGGLSHNGDERTAPEDLIAGAQALADTLASLDNALW